MENLNEKAVLASLKPYFYYLVGEGIKTNEVRKTFPKARDWNKDTYFYMSRDEKSFAKIPKEFQEKYRKHFGKVGLRFVCDSIETIYYQPSYYFMRFGSCLSNSEMWEYGRGKPLYGWHITDLVIYEKPRELWQFHRPCDHEGDCYTCKHWDYFLDNSDGHCLRTEMDITRPPQSWCYVEEVQDGK